MKKWMKMLMLVSASTAVAGCTSEVSDEIKTEESVEKKEAVSSNKMTDGEKAVNSADPEKLISYDSDVAVTGENPNVIMIVLDDMGYSDFGCYGSEINTPNIDKLAANGLRYNNFHVTP